MILFICVTYMYLACHVEFGAPIGSNVTVFKLIQCPTGVPFSDPVIQRVVISGNLKIILALFPEEKI